MRADSSSASSWDPVDRSSGSSGVYRRDDSLCEPGIVEQNKRSTTCSVRVRTHMDAESSIASPREPLSILTDSHGTAGSLHDAQGTVSLCSDHINEWDNERAMRHYLEHQTQMVQKEHSEKIQEHPERFEPIFWCAYREDSSQGPVLCSLLN